MSWLAPESLLTHLSRQVLTQLSTGQGRAEGWDAQVLQDALDHAEGVVRGKLSGRIEFGPDDPGGLISDCTRHLAIEALFLRQPGEAAKLPEGWKSAVKGAYDDLQSMVEGLIPIPTMTTSPRIYAALKSSTPGVDRAFRDLLP